MGLIIRLHIMFIISADNKSDNFSDFSDQLDKESVHMSDAGDKVRRICTSYIDVLIHWVLK